MKRIISYYSNISGIVIDQMIVGSEIEIEITKVIGEADQGPENNTEMRKGIYTINEMQKYQNLCIITNIQPIFELIL